MLNPLWLKIVTSGVAVVSAISLILNYKHDRTMHDQANQGTQYASTMFHELAGDVYASAVALGYHNVQVRYPEASADIAAAASDLRALAQYRSTVQGQPARSGRMFPAQIMRDANYLSFISQALVNRSPGLGPEGQQRVVTRQEAQRFVLQVNVILQADTGDLHPTQNRIRSDADRIYKVIPSIVKTQFPNLLMWQL